MRQYARLTNVVLLATMALVGFGLYGFITHDSGGFFILSRTVNLYLFVFHPVVIFILARLVLNYHDHTNLPEAVIFSLLILPLAPTIFILIPVAADVIAVKQINPTALEVVFFIFEIGVLIVGVVFFVRYAKRYATESLVPKDLYAMFHYLIGMMVYFYFIRLTILSSLLVTGAV